MYVVTKGQGVDQTLDNAIDETSIPHVLYLSHSLILCIIFKILGLIEVISHSRVNYIKLVISSML